MKNSVVTTILTHPLLQLILFCGMFFCGDVICVPYVFVLKSALAQGQLFAVLGLLGILLCCICLFTRRFWLQGWALLCMWASLLLHIAQVDPGVRGEMIRYPVQYIILFVFLAVTLGVIFKRFVWRNY